MSDKPCKHCHLKEQVAYLAELEQENQRLKDSAIEALNKVHALCSQPPGSSCVYIERDRWLDAIAKVTQEVQQ